MPRRSSSILEQIQNSETRFKELLEKRNKELLNIITKSKAVTIDDNLLAGFLMFALNVENANHPILQEFKELAKSNKTPSRAKKPSIEGAEKRS